MRVAPPTRMTSSRSAGASFASASARRQCARVRSTIGRLSSSSSSRVSSCSEALARRARNGSRSCAAARSRADASPRSPPRAAARLPPRHPHGDAALFTQMRNDRRIDIVAAEPRVAVRREHFEDAVVQLQNGDVERAAAEIVDGDLRAARSAYRDRKPAPPRSVRSRCARRQSRPARPRVSWRCVARR